MAEEKKCTHNEMVERKDDPNFAWECAKCGYIYGAGNPAPLMPTRKEENPPPLTDILLQLEAKQVLRGYASFLWPEMTPEQAVKIRERMLKK